MKWQPDYRRPNYDNGADACAYKYGYERGFLRRPRDCPIAARWPNAYSRGYWDGFADNPKGEVR